VDDEYTDENKQWLKPKKNKNLFADDEKEEVMELGNDETYNDEFDADGPGGSDVESDVSSDEMNDGEEAKLDIEKQSKKLREKQRKTKELAEQELLTNIEQQEKVQFPSGQEVTKEAPLADLQLLMHRIREVINVLNSFTKKREVDRTRKDYIDLLKQDLCSYYSYNDFLMSKLIELFPLAEIIDFFWKPMKYNGL